MSYDFFPPLWRETDCTRKLVNATNTWEQICWYGWFLHEAHYLCLASYPQEQEKLPPHSKIQPAMHTVNILIVCVVGCSHPTPSRHGMGCSSLLQMDFSLFLWFCFQISIVWVHNSHDCLPAILFLLYLQSLPRTIMPCHAFFCCQGLFRGQMQRLRMPSTTGSTLIFSTTSLTTWWLFLLLCGPMLHINMELSLLVSEKAKYNRTRPSLVILS